MARHPVRTEVCGLTGHRGPFAKLFGEEWVAENIHFVREFEECQFCGEIVRWRQVQYTIGKRNSRIVRPWQDIITNAPTRKQDKPAGWFRSFLVKWFCVGLLSCLPGCYYWSEQTATTARREFTMMYKRSQEHRQPNGSFIRFEEGPDGDSVASVSGAAASAATGSFVPAVALGVRRGTGADSLISAPAKVADNLTTSVKEN